MSVIYEIPRVSSFRQTSSEHRMIRIIWIRATEWPIVVSIAHISEDR